MLQENGWVGGCGCVYLLNTFNKWHFLCQTPKIILIVVEIVT